MPDYSGHRAISNLAEITPHFSVHRLSGDAPMRVHATSRDTTATLSDGGAAFSAANYGRAFAPWLDLGREWDFGDPASTETFADPRTGEVLNTNDGQTAPDATHLYRTPGTYTITLRVKGRLPNGTFVEATPTTTIRFDEVHQIDLRDGAAAVTGGTFRLSFDGGSTWTGHIAYNAMSSAAEGDADPGDGLLTSTPFLTIQAACEEILGAGNVHVVGGGMHALARPACVIFRGSLGGQAQTHLTQVDASNLTGAGTPNALVRVLDAGTTAASIAVEEFDGTAGYFDSTYVDNPADGTQGSITRPWTTGAQLLTFINGAGKDDRRAYLKRGSSFTTASRIHVEAPHNDRSIVAYGEGDRPIWTTSATQHLYVEGTHGTSDVGPILVDGVEFRETGSVASWVSAFASGNTQSGATQADRYAALRDLDLIDCRFAGVVIGNGVDPPWEASLQGFTFAHGIGLWRCEFDRGPASTITSGAILGGACRWYAVVGGSFVEAGTGTLTNFEHHIYAEHQAHGLFLGIAFVSSVSRSFCFNLDSGQRQDGYACTRYTVVDCCDLTGTHHGIDLGNSNNDGTADVSAAQYGRFSGAVIHRCAIHTGQIGTDAVGVWATCVKGLAVRDNVFFGQEQADIHIHRGVEDADVSRNRSWDDGATPFIFVPTMIATAAPTGRVSGNSVLRIGSGARIVQADFAVELASVSFDANNYHTPDSTTPFHDEGGAGARSLAQWQAAGFDADATTDDPGWIDPANGDFRTTADLAGHRAARPGSLRGGRFRMR